MILPKGASPSLQGPALETLPWLARFDSHSSLIASPPQRAGRPIVGACFEGNAGDLQSWGLRVVSAPDGPKKADSGFLAQGSASQPAALARWATSHSSSSSSMEVGRA